MNDRKRLILNVDPELHAAVAELAREDLRSMNAEAVTLLREAIEHRRAAKQAESAQTLKNAGADVLNRIIGKEIPIRRSW